MAEKKETSLTESSHKDNLAQPAKDFNIDAFIDKRREFIQKVNGIMVEGKDYHVIQGKKSMAKGGAEKIGNIFGWTAKFSRDTESVEMFGNQPGLVAFVCNLTKSGKAVGQGRGAALLSKNGGDPNKTLKMAQKSAFIDAVIRASGLSDFYTQDLEDMDIRTISKPQARDIGMAAERVYYPKQVDAAVVVPDSEAPVFKRSAQSMANLIEIAAEAGDLFKLEEMRKEFVDNKARYDSAEKVKIQGAFAKARGVVTQVHTAIAEGEA